MRKSFRGRREPVKETKEFKVNERILAPKLVVIDENGENLGILDRGAALSLAQERELDLVEVSPKAETPIAKILNYNSFRYQQEKQEKKQKAKQKTSEVKTVKLSLRISQHDLDFKAAKATEFLENGDKARVELQLRGRENQHADLAFAEIKKFVETVKNKLGEKKILKTEQGIKKMGNKISIIVSL
ncbi:MAG: translation initiation factor IF-3 [Patescibacteria group bacterium]